MPPERDDATPAETKPLGPTDGHGRFVPGTVIENRYRIVALVGRGGMGEVYRADDLKIGQTVALKFLPVTLDRDGDRLRRLLGEVRIARQVSHTNVCRAYDVGECEGHHFITMEFVDGEDLAALQRRIGRLPQEKALEVSRQICAGLAAAHVQEIVHRDLKPANIMLDGRGRARITDFGLAAAVGTLRGDESRWGTPAYMAPEQLAGGEVSRRTDVYSLGLVLYELFTGKRAFETPAVQELSVNEARIPARPSSHLPGLDPAIDATILKCLERDPAKRPASAVDLLAALPGGDPLAAAIRAGETPSPEMVAEAGEEGSLSAAKAWGLLGFALLSAAAAIFCTARTAGLDRVAMPRSPDALRERAREIVRQVGGDVQVRSSDWWIQLDDGYAEWFATASHSEPSSTTWPLPVRFNYRQSPKPLALPSGPRPSRRDPAPTWSGEAFVALDLQGHLLELSRLDRQLTPVDSVRTPAVDWNPLLERTAAGVNRLRPVEPVWTPDVACDTRGAWVGSDAGVPVRCEAAAWRGRPVWFRTIAPWARPERDTLVPPRGALGFAFFVAVALALLVAFGVLARHNLRHGRTDTRGALRFGLAIFLSFGLAISLTARWDIEPRFVWRWVWRQPYFPMLVAWLWYLGVEPFLRRRWPHRLVAWSRLLEARFTDPLVGREVLVGFLAGAGVVLTSCIPGALERHADLDLLIFTLPLSRAADFWAAVANAFGDSLMKGMGAFGILLILRIFFRRDAAAWVGLIVAWILLSLPSWNLTLFQWISLAAGSGCFVVAMRVGLVAAISAMLVSNLLAFCTPLTLDLSRWYAWRTGVVAALLLLLALWGFRAVMGRRQILSATMLEG